MNLLRANGWFSFRLRLTLFLGVAMGILLWAYGYAISQKLWELASGRVERRLELVGARWIGELREDESRFRRRPGPEGEEWGILFGTLGPGGEWSARAGIWPEELRAWWIDWIETAGSTLPPLSPPAPPERLRGAPREAGPRPVATPRFPRWSAAQREKLRFIEVSVNGKSWALLSARIDDQFAVLAYDLSGEWATVRHLVRLQNLSLPFFILLVLLLTWVLATRALRPIHHLARTMARLSGPDLAARLSEKGVASEFRDLITVFNAMMERLERSFQQASRFSADAAHELKTPLTVLQGELEAALAAAATGSAGQRQLSSMLDEVQRLKHMTERLLLLARADAGRLLGEQSQVDLATLLGELLEDVEAASPELTVTAQVAPAEVFGDPVLLRQAILNLLSNATRYNLPAGWVRVRLESTAETVLLTVANASEPIEREAQAHLFDRFFRVDSARRRAVDGLGLGLSLTREIARAHGGDLTLVAGGTGETAFQLTLARHRRAD